MSTHSINHRDHRSTHPGFLAGCACIKHSSHPWGYRNRTKWTITGVVALTAATAPMSASIFYSAITDASHDLAVSPSVINVSVAVHLAASSIFPLWWATFSELFGRRAILLLTFALNIPLTAACALSPNIASLIAFRLLSGSASASGQTVGAGVIADIWKPEERAFAMSIFYLGPLVGPLFLPLVGGGLTQVWGWRSVMWFMAAQGVLVLAMVLLLLPETLCNHNNNADHQGSESPRLKAEHFLDPITSVAILRFPTVFIPVFIAAMAFGTCYVINISVQEAFSNEPYQYSPTIVGFLFLPNSIGCILVSVYGGKWVDRIMIKSAEQAGRRDNSGEAIYLPEDRLGLNAWISLALYPASIIVYGWLVQTGVTWAAPAAATFVFGAGVMMIFSATTTMAAEFVPGNSSIGIAVNNLIRNIFSSGGTAITQPLLNVMGHGWLFTMIGIIAWATGYLGVFLLKRYSEKWRGSLGKALR